MLLGGLTTPVQASTYRRRVIVSAALIFHTSGATSAAGQIHRDALMDSVGTVITNNRWRGRIVNSVAANGWAGHTVWTHQNNLSARLPLPRP